MVIPDDMVTKLCAMDTPAQYDVLMATQWAHHTHGFRQQFDDAVAATNARLLDAIPHDLLQRSLMLLLMTLKVKILLYDQISSSVSTSSANALKHFIACSGQHTLT